MKVLLAMSGGVDSSVVAHLLREQGHEVVGVRFNLWTDPLAPALAQVLPTKCCTTQNIARASNVAKKLGIPLTIIDLEQEFKETVVDPFLEGHKKGLTPNPCIGCNRNIKFGKLLTLAQELGCDRLATGHYARTAVEDLHFPRSGDSQIVETSSDVRTASALQENSEKTDHTQRYLLLESVDKKKDQSYYLYGLTQEQLKLVSFPLGGMLKSEVYQLAEHFGIPLPDSYRESQDLCFFPEKTPDEFLKRHLGSSVLPGEITRKNGVVVGKHEGLPLYTVGQRRGLGVGGLKVPLEVVEKDTVHNRLIVADRGSVKANAVRLSDMRFVAWKPKVDTPLPFECRVRSLSMKKRGELTITATGAVFRFSSPQSPQAPGQSLVLYRGEEVVGGGVMERDI